MVKNTEITLQTAPGLIALNKWTRAVGVKPVTAWRWRKRGWLRTVNICGRPYVTAEECAEFNRRAAAGEFTVRPPGDEKPGFAE